MRAPVVVAAAAHQQKFLLKTQIELSPEHILHSSSNAEGNTSAIGEQDNNTSTALQNIGSILAGEDFPLGTYIL